MVIGKFKYWIAPRPEYIPHHLELVPMWPGHMRLYTLGRWARSMKWELKEKVAWVTRSPCVCLGLLGQVKKFDSNRPFLVVIETA